MKSYDFKLTPAYCLYNGIAVVKQEGSRICFMAENPADQVLRNRLKKAFANYLDFVTRQEDCPQNFKSAPAVSFVGGNRNEIRKYVSSLYSIKEPIKGTSQLNQENSKETDSAAVILLDTIIAEARSRNATDIHIEKNNIKFRINGLLESYSYVSTEKAQELIQRIKFLAGMNVLEKRRSQDGHFVYGDKSPVFIRVSVMGVIGTSQTEMEESVVIRLLDTNRLPLELDRLGFTEEQLQKIGEMLLQKNGLIVICGPTGAGKSTTAAALLLEIQKERNSAVKIISLEDPPEYVIPGVTQIQIDEKIENSFSEALRHVFRQDPDVLMIGEIRDENSAAVAIKASLTGHLVIATLHCSSAAGVILRLENLGVPVNLVASVLKGVVVQELKPLCGKVALAADISIPDKNLEKALEKNLPEEALGNYFEHNTNYSQVVFQAIGLLSVSQKSKVIKNSTPKILLTNSEKEKEENAV